MSRRGTTPLAVALALLVVAVAAPPLTAAECLPAEERRRIEALIGAVEKQTDVTFIRNDRDYNGAAAARFLRGKWRSRQAEVCSADDFIAQVASVSSTSGTPYRVRLKDRREIPAAEFFRAQLPETSPRR